MDFLEKDLEQIIYEATDEQLGYKGIEIDGIRKRQLRIGSYGIADMVTFKRRRNIHGISYLDITVYELKKDKIGISALLQAINYVKGIQHYLYNRKSFDVNFEIVLIGRKIDTSGSFCFIPDLICDPNSELFPTNYITRIKFFVYDYNFDGIFFYESDGYKLSHHGFDSKHIKAGF